MYENDKKNNEIPESVICPDCKKKLKVIHFGYGYMAVCFDCHKTVYDDRKNPKDGPEEE